MLDREAAVVVVLAVFIIDVVAVTIHQRIHPVGSLRVDAITNKKSNAFVCPLYVQRSFARSTTETQDVTAGGMHSYRTTIAIMS